MHFVFKRGTHRSRPARNRTEVAIWQINLINPRLTPKGLINVGGIGQALVTTHYQSRYDVRLALRQVRRGRAFSLTVILTLALAIALNVVAFTIMNAMVFRGLPLTRQSDRVVYIGLLKPSGQRASLRYTDFEVWR